MSSKQPIRENTFGKSVNFTKYIIGNYGSEDYFKKALQFERTCKFILP